VRRPAYHPKPRDEVRRNMSAIRSRDNRTERQLRRALHALGLRYRKYDSGLFGQPDIVFPASRVVVFVDGDYWHARALVEGDAAMLERRLRRLPIEARQYWRTKFRQRVKRDAEVTRQLRNAGWLVLRFWESEVRANPAPAVRKIASSVKRRRRR